MATGHNKVMMLATIAIAYCYCPMLLPIAIAYCLLLFRLVSENKSCELVRGFRAAFTQQSDEKYVRLLAHLWWLSMTVEDRNISDYTKACQNIKLQHSLYLQEVSFIDSQHILKKYKS